MRGIGIINVARVFGIGAVRSSVEVEMVVQLEPWDRTKNYDRTGLETEYYDILGVKVPSMLIPVMPGRNLAVILETAAINNRQKEMGYNAAKELLTDPFRSAAEVASMVGYEDSSYFARTFKKRTGMTPTQYRKEAAKTIREARL